MDGGPNNNDGQAAELFAVTVTFDGAGMGFGIGGLDLAGLGGLEALGLPEMGGGAFAVQGQPEPAAGPAEEGEEQNEGPNDEGQGQGQVDMDPAMPALEPVPGLVNMGMGMGIADVGAAVGAAFANLGAQLAQGGPDVFGLNLGFGVGGGILGGLAGVAGLPVNAMGPNGVIDPTQPALATRPCSDFHRYVAQAPVDVSVGADEQVESALFKLPAELLGMLVGFIGPRTSRSVPRYSPANLFYTCKAMLEISRLASTRVAFLMGNYGVAELGDGIGDWLRIVNPVVLDAALGRAGKEDPVPRYQLQRLHRRIQVCGRHDLVPPLVAYHERVYPTFNPQPFSSRPFYSLPYGGPGATITDDELFKIMLNWNYVPEGCEALVLEGISGGWHVESDSVLTALLTLRNKYGLPISHTCSGRSDRSQALEALSYRSTNGALNPPMPSRILGGMGSEKPVDAKRDTHVPGTDAAHALLIRKAAEGDAVAVSRLIHLGVSCRLPRQTSFLWKILDTLGLASDDKPIGTVQHSREASENAKRCVDIAVGTSPSDRRNQNQTNEPAQEQLLPMPTQKANPITILDTLCVRRGVPSPYCSVRQVAGGTGGHQGHAKVYLDAVEAAAAAGKMETLAMLLGYEEEGGADGVEGGRRWESEDGQKVLGRCLDLCKDNANCYNLIRGYCTSKEDTDKSVDLLTAFLSNDVTTIKKLSAENTKLSVSQIAVILKTPAAAPSYPLLLKIFALSEPLLENLLRHLVPSAGFPPQGAADPALSDSVRQLLAHYSHLWPKQKGKQILQGVFERTSDPWRRVVRGFMGTVEEIGVGSRVARWDLKQAVLRNDVQATRDLHSRGVRLPLTVDLLGHVRPAPHQDALIALIDVQSGTPAELTRMLSECVYFLADRVVTHLLDSCNTMVDDISLLECMARNDDPARQLYTKMLGIAQEKQRDMIPRAGALEVKVKAMGGVWAEEWKKYKASFDTEAGEGSGV